MRTALLLGAAALLLTVAPVRADMASDMSTLSHQLLQPLTLADFRTVGAADKNATITSSNIDMLDKANARVTMNVQVSGMSVPHVFMVHRSSGNGAQVAYKITKPDQPKFHLMVGLDSAHNVVLLQGPGKLF